MLTVGWVGGLSYANTLYQIFEDKKIKYSQKEISLTINALFNESAIFLQSLVGIVFLKYFLNK